MLAMVSKENQDDEQKILARQAATRKCTNEECGKTFDVPKRKCDVCFSKVEKQVKSIERLTGQKQKLSHSFDFDVDVNQNKAELKMRRPIICNPSSYESVATILDSFKQQMDTNKQLTILGCDGPPYCLASRNIDNDREG